MKILLTAFGPFGGERINPAQEAAALVRELPGIELTRLTVPVTFRESGAVVTDAMRRIRPDAVLCVGQAGGRSAVTPERIAINLDDARIPDNEGAAPADVPVDPDGPAAIFASLPVKAMVRRIGALGIPAAVSNSAGTFVCNHLMYCVLRECEKHPGMRGGFLHVPYCTEQVTDKPDVPALPLPDIVRAIEAALEAIHDGQQ